MATLTNDDFTEIKNWFKGQPIHYDAIRLSGLSKTQLKAGLQAIEDYSTGSYNIRPAGSLKAAIETATGITPTLAQNSAMWAAWASWKGPRL